MITIGLTGGIGMGKTTTAALFEGEGIPVWDADKAVHRLYSPRGFGVAPILERFPGVGGPLGGINRVLLAEAVLGKPAELKALEEIVHPLVAADQRGFLEAQERAGAEIVLLDIPLLLENNPDRSEGIVVVCSAPEDVRKARVLARPGMTEEKYAAIFSAQMPEEEKLKLADYIVPTGEGFEVAREKVREILADIRAKALDAGGKQPQD